MRITSLDIANYYHKQHKHVRETVRSLLKRHPEYKKYFVNSNYRNTQNKNQPLYIITKKGYKILQAKYELGTHVARLECTFKDWLKILLPNEEIETQYHILKYRLDFYFKKYNLAIEYDEEDHKNYTYEQQEGRQREIEKELGCKFIRVKEGNEIEGVKNILSYISKFKDLNQIFKYK